MLKKYSPKFKKKTRSFNIIEKLRQKKIALLCELQKERKHGKLSKESFEGKI